MDSIGPKIIRSGPHALRFYVADGWRRGDVESLLESGEVMSFDLVESAWVCAQSGDHGYFVAVPGSRFNRKRLVESCLSFFPANSGGKEAPAASMSDYVDV